jgi:hypothetical protein
MRQEFLNPRIVDLDAGVFRIAHFLEAGFIKPDT